MGTRARPIPFLAFTGDADTTVPPVNADQLVQQGRARFEFVALAFLDHLIGAAAKRATGVRWVADLRDSLGAHPHRRAESRLVRAKEATGATVVPLASTMVAADPDLGAGAVVARSLGRWR